MSLISQDKKQIFNTPFIANHDASGLGDVDPQPLNVDGQGNLQSYINGGFVSSKIALTPQTAGESETLLTAGQMQQLNPSSESEKYLIVGGVNNNQTPEQTNLIKGNYTPFSTDQAGALDVGGIFINNIPDDAGSQSAIIDDDNTATLNSTINSLRYDLIQDGLGLGYKRMYAFSQTITSVGGNKLMVNVSCYFGN